ncbi:MAG: hypothetical protein NZ898_03175 [Myxococcota bacterium]|nr:hypothetical protein [Myxococcota bacterium]MDW8363881.1 hypothetical protein [Myxococcales bacterium]
MTHGPFGTEARWLFDRRTDLVAFGGSALASLVLLAGGAAAGIATEPTPGWVFLLCVVAVDVAHVWSTAWRVYLDPEELRRRLLLYAGVPFAAWLVGVALHAVSAALFWRVLAYVAVVHFVRQQVGWMRLYRRRVPDATRFDGWLDEAAILAATLAPLLWWHAHLPRRFAWFVPGDFVPGLPEPVGTAALLLGGATLLAWLVRQLLRVVHEGVRALHTGKLLLVVSTAACWWLGIVAFDGDYAFTVTNVLVHGVPYLVLTFRWARMRASQGHGGMGGLLRVGALGFVSLAIAVAAVEEGLWDLLVWHDWLGVAVQTPPLALVFVVPLLAVPQATHYVLDAFVWRTRDGSNPQLAQALETAIAPRSSA